MRTARILISLVFFLVPTTLLAQNGKIAGRVTDATNGDALPGVNVVLQGTTIGSTTDGDGYYTILNVPPATYSLRASFIGFADAIVQDVIVQIGLTTNQNLVMSEEAVGLEQVVVTAEAPIIQRDISGSQVNITSEEIESAAFQNVNNVMAGQVSVNAVGVYNDRPRIRASGLEESKFIVDGVDQSDALTNRPYQRINLDAVEQVELKTGGFSAEYGNFQSGIVNVVTKSGGERYSGSVNFQFSPAGLKHLGPMPYGHESSISRPFVNDGDGAFTGNDFFQGWNAEAENPSRDPQHTGNPQALHALWMWRHRSQDSIDKLQSNPLVKFADGVDPDGLVFHETGDTPDYNVNLTFGGPIPGLDNVRFFTSYDATQTEYFSQFPQESYQEQNFRGKVSTTLGKDTRLNLHGYFGTQKGGDGGQGPGVDSYISNNPFRSLGGSNKFWYSHCAVPGQQTRQIYGGQVSHTLDKNSFVDLDLTHHRVDYEMLNDIRNTAPLPAVDGQTSRLQGVIGTDEQIAAWSDPNNPEYIQGYENWKDWALVQIDGVWYDEGPVGYSPVWWVDVTGYYRMSSCNVRFNDTNSRSWDFKGAWTSQINRHNQIKTGIQFRADDIFQDYRALDPSVNGGSVQISDAAPMMIGAYITDKLEYEGFVANIGLRLDGFISGTFPILDGDPTSDTGVYSTLLLPGNTTTTDADGNANFDFQELIPQAKNSQWRISPRIGISHPISTVAKIFFNYGHMYQRPDAYQMYRIQYNTRQGNRIAELGNPLLEPPRTIAYEVGYEHNLLDKVQLQLTGYFKDVNNRVNQARYNPLGQSAYDRYENQSFRDIRGLEFMAELRRGSIQYFSGYLNLNYLVESGGSFGFDRYFQDPTQQSRQVSSQVSEPDVRPIIKSGINFHTPEDFGPSAGNVPILGGWDISLNYFWQRGYHFTWNPAELPLVENNARWRPYQRWDMRLTKDVFSNSAFSASFYVDVRNLFQNHNLTPSSGTTLGDENLTASESFAWSGQRWFNDTFETYMFSLGYTAANQNDDGTFSGAKRVGAWNDSSIELPPWDSFRFLEARDIFFGLRLNF